MFNIKVLVLDGVVVETEVNGGDAQEVIDAVKKLNKELGTKTEMRFEVSKDGIWQEASG